jgi:hypothetical protein
MLCFHSAIVLIWFSAVRSPYIKAAALNGMHVQVPVPGPPTFCTCGLCASLCHDVALTRAHS